MEREADSRVGKEYEAGMEECARELQGIKYLEYVLDPRAGAKSIRGRGATRRPGKGYGSKRERNTGAGRVWAPLTTKGHV